VEGPKGQKKINTKVPEIPEPMELTAADSYRIFPNPDQMPH